ncbi:hypothetical protein FRC07_006722 [Ceratobasidium sp. 392]|nr:hypothetical protein FRC07_006722 [Ceratobasidium sp. 392]
MFMSLYDNTATALQGPAAWNTIIQAALEAKRYNLAYTQFLAMKKRAIQPTVATFSIFLTAYAKADPEILTSIQLERAQKMYNDWSNLASSGQSKKPKDLSGLHPAAAYIDVLANAGAYRKIWDVFYELDAQGPLAPNQHVFTSMFITFTKRAGRADTSTPDNQGIGAQDTQDAKLIWRNVIRSAERQPFPIDSHLVTAALRALRHGGEAEHELAFSIIGEYLGLQPPGSTPSVEPSRSDAVLSVQALDATLAVCRSAGRLDLIKHYVDTLIHSKNPSRAGVVTTSAMDHLLFSYASVGNASRAQETIDWMLREAALPNGLDVRPGNGSWALAFRACVNAKDWNIAESLLNRMTRPHLQSRGEREWIILPDAETTYLILKAAYMSQPPDKRDHNRRLQAALQVVEFVSRIWVRRTSSLDQLAEVHPTRALRRLVFQNELVGLVETVLDKFTDLRDRRRWAPLRRQIGDIQVELPEGVTDQYHKDF